MGGAGRAEGPVNIPVALELQRIRRAARTKAQGGRELRGLSDAGASAFLTQRALQRAEDDQRRLADPLEQAKLALQRRGRVVYRMAVHGGRADRWFISGLGCDRTDADLLSLAASLAA